MGTLRVVGFSVVFLALVAGGAIPYRAPKPSWPPRPLDDLNGRRLEFFAHGTRPEWGYADNYENLFAVVHSAVDGPGRPLVVVLHSAGHDLMTCLRCVRQEGNHDIYTVPKDMFGLYLDCRYSGVDWWWGYSGKGVNTFAESPLEKRVVATVEWAVSKYGLDRNRVYLCGNSMGASGTLGIGLRHGDVFAAIKANTPAGVEHACSRIGAPPETVPEGFALPDPPVCVDYSSQTDKWSKNHERLIAALHDRKWPYMLFWGAFGHVNNDDVLVRYNDVVHDFDWLSVRRDEPYPVFTDATSDGKSPWPITVTEKGVTCESDRPGQMNGFFRWRTVSQTERKVEMDLHLANPPTKFPELRSPESATAFVALRRLTAFAPAHGAEVRWTFGTQSGTVRVDRPLTLPRLTVTRAPTRLTVSY